MGLQVHEVRIAGYRSIRRIRFPVGRLSVFVGANGTGKTNLYRSLQLLQAAALGTLARDLAEEGGLEAVSFAGERKKHESPRLMLGVDLAGGEGEGEASYAYDVEIGAPQKFTSAAFELEPQIKRETLSQRVGRRTLPLLDRAGPHATAVEDSGLRRDYGSSLMASETALAGLGDASALPDVHLVRRLLGEWRFYHGFRTDRGSPLRQPCLAVSTPTLASDGHDLASVFATLAHIREDTRDLDAAIDAAFPGAELVIAVPGRRASFGMVFPDHPKRLFEASELSDGTLHFLALAGALLAYRLPPFLALNEPEASLHPDLLDPLARLIVDASLRTQIWLVTHSDILAAAIARHGDATPMTVVKRDGATWLEGLRLIGDFGVDDA